MSAIYEIYCENKRGDVVFCGDTLYEREAEEELRKLKLEFPEHDYWYEITYEDD